MPIYAYRCAECGFAKDVLQKMSDDPLTVCPSCHQSSFQKQVTAAGFQLKGSGWYVTDFRGGSGGASTAPAESSATETKSTSDATATKASTAESTSSGEKSGSSSENKAA